MDQLVEHVKTKILESGNDMKAIFTMIDKNGDGTLTLLEFEAAFPVLGIEVKTADV